MQNGITVVIKDLIKQIGSRAKIILLECNNLQMGFIFPIYIRFYFY